MNTVNKYNYEAFLLDFAEGHLSAAETNLLFEFLAAHPELKEDFDVVLEMNSLPHEAVEYRGKINLLKDETQEGVQDLIIALIEGVQTDEEKQSLNDLMKHNTAIESELLLFSKLKLEEDAALVFSRKSVLIQSPVITVNFGTWLYRATYAAAAVVLLMLMFNNLNFGPTRENQLGARFKKIPQIDLSKRSNVASNDPQMESYADTFVPKSEIILVNAINAAPSQVVTEPHEVYVAMQNTNRKDLVIRTDSNRDLAVVPEEVYSAFRSQESEVNLLDLIAQESNFVNMTYSLAGEVSNRLKVAQKKYTENDYIEINFWKVHTQIRKPSWLRLPRKY